MIMAEDVFFSGNSMTDWTKSIVQSNAWLKSVGWGDNKDNNSNQYDGETCTIEKKKISLPSKPETWKIKYF